MEVIVSETMSLIIGYRAELGDIQSVLFTHEDEAEANKFLQEVKKQ